MKKTIFNRLSEFQKKLAIISSIIILLGSAYKVIDLRAISRIKQERQKRENLENVVNSIKGVLLSELKKVDGTFFVRIDDNRIRAYIGETKKGDKYVFVEDGGSTIYSVNYDSGKEQYYYINYKGKLIDIYNRNN